MYLLRKGIPTTKLPLSMIVSPAIRELGQRQRRIPSIFHRTISHSNYNNNYNSSDAYEMNSLLLHKNLLPKSSNSQNTRALRCVVFDAQGNVTNIASDIKKSELIQKHELLPRDLRKIDKGYNDIVPSILIRDRSILLNLLHVNALIKSDTVVLFNHSNSSHSHAMFINELQEKLKSSNKADELPYEIRALEAMFVNVIDSLNSEMKIHVMVVNALLKELEDNIDTKKLKYLLLISKKLSQFLQKATLIRDLIDELLTQDHELAELYLTEKRLGNPRSEHDHQEVEMLLESYSLQCDAIVQTIESASDHVRTTEEIINIILDSNRNELMLLGLRFSGSLLASAAVLYFAAVYGMNLENFVEEKDGWFYYLSGGFVLVYIIFFALSIKKLNRVQKVTMMRKS